MPRFLFLKWGGIDWIGLLLTTNWINLVPNPKAQRKKLAILN
jgi:hypothetical protein